MKPRWCIWTGINHTALLPLVTDLGPSHPSFHFAFVKVTDKDVPRSPLKIPAKCFSPLHQHALGFEVLCASVCQQLLAEWLSLVPTARPVVLVPMGMVVGWCHPGTAAVLLQQGF